MASNARTSHRTITLVSDLHSEFYVETDPDLGEFADCVEPEISPRFWTVFESCLGTNAPRDILVLAGDIGAVFYNGDPSIYKSILQKICTYGFKDIVLVAGNHEFYHSLQQYETVLSILKNICEELGIHYLHRSSVTLSDTLRIYGCTLWSHLTDEAADGFSDLSPKNVFSDKARYIAEHLKDLEYLKNSIKDMDDSYQNVIVTHHLPIEGMIHPRFQGNPFNSAFASSALETEDLSAVSYVLSGHTHEFCKVTRDHCVFIANPLGYPGEDRVTVFEPCILPL